MCWARNYRAIWDAGAGSLPCETTRVVHHHRLRLATVTVEIIAAADGAFLIGDIVDMLESRPEKTGLAGGFLNDVPAGPEPPASGGNRSPHVQDGGVTRLEIGPFWIVWIGNLHPGGFRFIAPVGPPASPLGSTSGCPAATNSAWASAL